MKQFVLLLLSSVIGLPVFGQTVVGNAGEEFSNATAHIHFTVGEAAIEKFPSGTHSVLQGFHQPLITVDNTSLSEIPYGNISVFPNPATESVSLSFSNPKVDSLGLVLSDVTGSILQSKVIYSDTSIDLRGLAAGTYFLVLRSKQYQQSFTIQKIN